MLSRDINKAATLNQYLIATESNVTARQQWRQESRNNQGAQ
jgi:hypothetical protein